jgi:16S rRNA (guanine966-N2)-methyltransferase
VTRIVAGQLGGRRLEVPTAGTRPTADSTREALFSALTSALGSFEGVRFLDLFAGSGAIGLEAWSRGAASVVMVESAAPVLAVLRRNVALLADDRAVVVAGRAEAVVAHLAAPFDVVFADPPYALGSAELAATLGTLLERSLIAAGGLVVVERGVRDAWSWPAGLEPVRDRRYGDAVLWYGRARQTVSDADGDDGGGLSA